MYSAGGVFVVLIVGISIAICVAIYEFWYYHSKMRVTLLPTTSSTVSSNDQDGTAVKQIFLEDYTHTTRQRSLWVEMLEEFRYAWHCTDPRRRPVLRNRIDSDLKLHSLSEFKHESRVSHQESLNLTKNISDQQKSSKNSEDDDY